MKNDLISLLVKEFCGDRICENCNFWKPNGGCYLIDIIEIIKKNERENGNYEK